MACDVPELDLAALADGDLDEPARRQLQDHVAGCPRCAAILSSLQQADAALAGLPRPEVPPAALLAVRRALASALYPPAPEVMTLEEAGTLLRIDPQELAEVAEDLPAFEVAGQVRIRRDRLLAWVEKREREYARQRDESWVARSRPGLGKGVA